MPSGVIVVDKPAGWTSMDVCAKLRGALREKRVGHAGTLDPMATGVLPVLVGRATRACELVAEGEKEYLAALELGVTTDTQDSTGQVLERREAAVTDGALEEALEAFRGEIWQIPPMYSAIKKNGVKLYELARKGREVERERRQITVSALEVFPAWQAPEGFPRGEGIRYLRVACSKGTYVRTLCHDIGAALGCGGCMSALRRVRVGSFALEEAVSMETILAQTEAGRGETLLRGVDSCFPQYGALTATPGQERRIRCGGSYSCGLKEGLYRVYAPDGAFLMLGRVRQGTMETVKSFFEV